MDRRFTERSGLSASSGASFLMGDPRALAWLWKKPATRGSSLKVGEFWVRKRSRATSSSTFLRLS